MNDCTVTVKLAPLWNVRTDLPTLTGILGAVLYLSAPDDEDPEKADFITALVTVQETLARCAGQLHEAIQEGKFNEQRTKGGNA